MHARWRGAMHSAARDLWHWRKPSWCAATTAGRVVSSLGNSLTTSSSGYAGGFSAGRLHAPRSSTSGCICVSGAVMFVTGQCIHQVTLQGNRFPDLCAGRTAEHSDSGILCRIQHPRRCCGHWCVWVERYVAWPAGRGGARGIQWQYGWMQWGEVGEVPGNCMPIVIFFITRWRVHPGSWD